MNTQPGSWSSLLAARASDPRPWIIRPLRPQLDASHRATSYAELYGQARRIARALHRLGGRRGDRVLVVADNSVESALLLIGVIVSGLVVVPVAPRGLATRDSEYTASLRKVCRHCDPRFLLARAEQLPDAPPVAAFDFAQFTSGHPGTPETAARQRAPETGSLPDELALLQYTSGTTTAARGVELTHGSLLHNVRSIGEAIGASSADTGATWLPLFHDMGLIGCLLFTTYWGMPLVLMTPREFQMRPHSWLWAIARFRATCSVAPNSAYQFCTTKIAPRKLSGLDLSTWRAALTGSELIHPETLEAFSKRFANHGFRSEALLPVYGLAENTLAATFPKFPRTPRVDWVRRDALEADGVAAPSAGQSSSARGVVCVGRPLPGQELRVVAPDSRQPVGERTVGAIQVRGPCTMRGYHRASAKTAAVLDGEGWLDTGDRGYLLDGELYVVGREKHVIKRAGRSYDGADVERVLADVEGVRGGFVAAFGLPDSTTGTERLVVVAESRLSDPAQQAELRRALVARFQREFSARPDVIALWKPGSIPRTTSGKIRHDRARELYRSSGCATLEPPPGALELAHRNREFT